MSLAPRALVVALVAGSAAVMTPGGAEAYRGQYAVEEPDSPDQGECELNAWAARGAGSDYRLGTLSLECGLGLVAVSAELGRERLDGEWVTPAAATIMWSRALAPRFRMGIQGVVDYDDATRLQQLRLNLPFSYEPSPDLAFIVNVGRELARGHPDRTHVGLALRWSFLPDWSVRLERSRFNDDRGTRGGIRHQLNRAWAIDVSRTSQHPWHGDRKMAWWTIGLIHQWGGAAP